MTVEDLKFKIINSKKRISVEDSYKSKLKKTVKTTKM